MRDPVSPDGDPAPPAFPKKNNFHHGENNFHHGDTTTTTASASSNTISDSLVVQQQKTPLFANSDVRKERVWEALRKPEYNVANFYHETGIWRKIATHSVFENLTLAVISVNALWIAIDTDSNPAATLLEAQPVFQVAEHLFCWYFSFEWYVRFSSFRIKRDGLKDAWFVFDSCLVFMMVAETWVMTMVLLCLGSAGGSGMGGASILRLFRLLRLSRLARMLRSMPELMILIKGMLAASRSVFFTMCLLVILLYLFAIMLRQLTDGTPVGDEYFYSVPASMYKLLIEGVFLDNLGYTADTIAESGPVYAVVFFVFVVCAALMVMNMLIGVLCEVVSAVASTEKEEMDVHALKTKLAEVMNRLDTSGNGMLSEEEFVVLVSEPKSALLLEEVGVDPIALIDMAPSIFEVGDEEDEEEEDDDGEEKPKPEKEINFTEFMKIVLDLRGSNSASLKDLRVLRNDLVNEMETLKVRLNVSSRRRSSCGSVPRRSSASQAVIDRCVSAASSATAEDPTRCVSTVSVRPRTAPCDAVPGSCGADAQGAEPLTPQTSVQVTSVRGEGAPSSGRFPSARGEEARDGPDMQEVHVALCSLQLALAKAQRPGVPGAARAAHESERLDWVDSMSRAAVSHLERLQRMQGGCVAVDA